MSKNTLDTRVLRCTGTITIWDEVDDSQIVRNSLIGLLSSWDIVDRYYFILHDDAERLHFHFVITFDTQIRLNTILNKICAYLNCSRERVQIKKLTDLNAMLRYFLHLEESEDKKRYTIDEIVTNDDMQMLNHLLSCDEDSALNIKRLIGLILKFDDEVDLMAYLDLPLYHKYRHEIKVLYDRRMYVATHYKHLKLDDKQLDLPF